MVIRQKVDFSIEPSLLVTRKVEVGVSFEVKDPFFNKGRALRGMQNLHGITARDLLRQHFVRRGKPAPKAQKLSGLWLQVPARKHVRRAPPKTFSTVTSFHVWWKKRLCEWPFDALKQKLVRTDMQIILRVCYLP